jgi:Lantibiotic dehydratase, N terminus
MGTPQDASGSGQHTVELPGLPGWVLWRCTRLRASGLPAERVNLLREPAALAAARECWQASSELAAATEALVSRIDAKLDWLSAEGWESGGDGGRLLDARTALRAGRPTEKLPTDEFDAYAAVLAVAGTSVTAARSAFDAAYTDAAAHTAEVIASFAADSWVREAILWQNRPAFHGAVRPLADGSDARASKARQHQHRRLVVRYVQRYALKNDTIGFFGPFGWARIGDQAVPLAASYGPAVIGKRMVFFEQWAIDAVAGMLASSLCLDPWSAPRRLPFAYLEGEHLYPLDGPPVTLSPAQAEVLRCCDGQLLAHELAASLPARGIAGLNTPDDVTKCLDQLRADGVIAWEFEVPYVSYPERSLQEALGRVTDAGIRQTGLRAVAVLTAARDAVARAAGDPAALDKALGDAGAIFERLTGQPPVRSHGPVDVGHTMLFEDCVRDADVELGSAAIDRLGPALSLVLHSARWLTSQTAQHCRAELAGLHAELAASRRSPSVPLADVWRLMPRIFTFLAGDIPVESPLTTRVKAELQRRWSQVLGLAAEPREAGRQRAGRQGRISLRSSELADRVAAAFPAAGPGWELARYHSVDVMIAAGDTAAIDRADYFFVLGEIHLANNTITASDSVEAHPEPWLLRQYREQDLPAGCVFPVPSRNWRGMGSRTRGTLGMPGDYHVLVSHDFPSEPVDQPHLLSLAELVLEPDGDGLIIRSYDGRFRSDVIEFFGELLSLSVVDAFRMFSATLHVPRITVDDFVMQRETWGFPVRELSFAVAGSDAELFRQAVSWARDQDMPQQVFVSVPLEQKPVYVDFASPALVDVLAHMVRRTPQSSADDPVVFSELLPTLDQLWLSDRDGHRYTSEFRIVAVDQLGRARAV